MAPGQPDPEWPDVPDNDDAFLADLEVFHEKRGTVFERHPKVNTKPIDLFKLFGTIQERGGYDKVCAEKLLWRKISEKFGLGQNNAAAYAFALKTVYYRNLAAYEIKRVHKQEPPPKEILEQTTAKGGDLLNRTLENFRSPITTREQYVNGQESEQSEDELRKTPRGERMDIDDPGSTGGRATRGLRQAPAPRILYQPDVSSTRQSRQISNQAQSPQPAVPQQAYNANTNPTLNPNSSSFNIANYEPRQPVPLSLRPVPTPFSNPALFKEKIKEKLKRQRDAQSTQGKAAARNAIMQPGTGFDGPNIYVRTLLALRSGNPQEVDYSLHHLVKISHERGDKYKFDAFPGLAEGLIDQVLKVSSLFYDVNWEVSFDEKREEYKLDSLNGHEGTPDILDRIQQLMLHDASEDITNEDFSTRLRRCNEACLIVRNMSMLEENAKFLEGMKPVRDFLTIALNLPKQDCLIEYKHYALDICEQLTKYWIIKENDPLYISLLAVLGDGSDRGACLTALRAISRISMELLEQYNIQNVIKNVPLATIMQILDWTLLDDEELVGACLDFFYQFTAIPENVSYLLSWMEEGKVNLHSFLTQLSKLLTFRAVPMVEMKLVAPAIPPKTTSEIQDVPQDLMEEITPIPEPERSSAWLRSLFEEHAESDITQIALWQSYQARFTPHATQDRPLLPAAEFIKNVSTTFPSANAQVINGPQPRFIIKGIRPRLIPTDTKGRQFSRCLWTEPGSLKKCGSFQMTAATMWEHIVVQHIGLARNHETRQWNVESRHKELEQKGQSIACHWGGCDRFGDTNGIQDPFALGMHIKTHLPDMGPLARHRAKHNRAKRPRLSGPNDGSGIADDDDDPNGYPAEYETIQWNDTAKDERDDAAGIPFTSVLVLRSIARNVSKAMTTPQANALKLTKSAGHGGWMERLFGPIESRLFQVAATNRSLTRYVLDLVKVIEARVAEGE